MTFSPYGLKGAVKFNPSISFPCLNAAWNMIKEESEQRGTECAPQCHVWSCICYVSAGGERVSDSCCFVCPSWHSKTSLFICVFIHIMLTGNLLVTSRKSHVGFQVSSFQLKRPPDTLWFLFYLGEEHFCSVIEQMVNAFYFLSLVCFCGFLSIPEKFLCMTLNNRHTSHLFCRHKCCNKRKHCSIHPAVLKWPHIPEGMKIKK